MNCLHPGGEPGRHHRHFVPRLEDPPGNPAGIPTEIMPLVTLGTDHPLDGKAGIDMVLLAPNVDIFQMVEQRGTLIPGSLLRTLDNICSL